MHVGWASYRARFVSRSEVRYLSLESGSFFSLPEGFGAMVATNKIASRKATKPIVSIIKYPWRH